MLVELAVDDLLGGLDDGLADLGLQHAERHVGLGGGPLDDAERADHGLGLALPADLEVAEAALRLRAPVLVVGDFERAEGVGFGAGGLGHRGGPQALVLAGRIGAWVSMRSVLDQLRTMRSVCRVHQLKVVFLVNYRVLDGSNIAPGVGYIG